jgi:hypothetical protein
LAAGLLLAAGASGCGVQTLSYPTPPATAPVVVTTAPTLPSKLPAVSEAAVPGSPASTPLRIGPGRATLNGTVLGPSGPVGGATVEADRLVGDQTAIAKATTAADGSWSIGTILGGRYRVRAWQQPSLTLTSPQILFLGATQTYTQTLRLSAFTGPIVAAAVAPAGPVVGQTDNLVVQVSNPTVGPDGVERDLPDAGVSVTLTDGPQWLVQNGNPLPTGSNGQVLFQVSCQAPGSNPLSAAVGTGTTVSLQLPDCAAPPTTTSVPPTTVASTTTSSTCPPATTTPGAASTTTTPLGLC